MNFLLAFRIQIAFLLCLNYTFIFSQKNTTAPLSYYKKKVLEKVLTNLHQASGFREVNKPSIDLITTTQTAAYYNPINHSIQLEEKLYNLCSGFGKDSLQALAYIIAHEYSHALQKSISTLHSYISFIQPHDHLDKTLENETAADIQGSLLCYLAGYKPGRILKTLLDKIYLAYHLDLTNDSNYPSASKRKASIHLMQREAEGLIQLFETAFLLQLNNDFELAETCYLHILQNYRGPEIYNNLGICKVFRAMSLYPDDVDLYSYPFELDLNTNLYKTRDARGSLSIENLYLRNSLLQEAMKQFQTALEINPDYKPTLTNIVSCLNLLNQPMEAIRFFDSLKLPDTILYSAQQNIQKLITAIGISYALSGNDQCKDFFKACTSSSLEPIKQFAIQNLNIYQNTIPLKSQTTNCPIQDSLASASTFFNEVRLVPISRDSFTIRSKKLSFKYTINAQQTILEFNNTYQTILKIICVKQNPKNRLNLHRLTQLSPGNHQLSYIIGKDARYLQCKSGDILYKLNTSGKLLERIKFVRN